MSDDRPTTLPSAGDDHGFTLVELLVATVVGLIVLGLVAAVFMAIMHQQVRVSETSLSNDQAQAAAIGIQTTVRNSAKVEILSTEGAGNLLVASSRGSGDGSPMCEGWLFVPGSATSTGKVYYRKVAADAGAAGLVDANGANHSGWSLMLTNASQVSNSAGTPALWPVFTTEASGSVRFRLTATRSMHVDDGDAVVTLDSTAAQLPQSFSADEGCFA